MSVVTEHPLLSDYLRRWAREIPDREFLVEGDDRRSYSQVDAETDLVACALLAAGVNRGDRVALLSQPCPDAFLTFLAALRIGAIYLGLNPAYRVPELQYVLGDAKPVLVIDLMGHQDHAARERLNDGIRAAALDVPLWSLDRHEKLCTLAHSLPCSDAASLREAIARIEPRDAAALVYTSGSTGQPKGALLPQCGFSYCGFVQKGYMNARDDHAPRGFAYFPMNHVAALGDTGATTVVAGGTMVFQRKFDPSGVVRMISSERITSWGAIPAMLLMTVSDPSFCAADFSSVRMVVWGGNPAPVALVQKLRALGIGMCNVYGLTETVGNVTFASENDNDEVLAGTVGRADPRYEVTIRGADGCELADGTEGEICVRGDFLMTGYFNRPEATAETFHADGWMRTGDAGLRRADGCFELKGRIKEMFKSGGYNVYPREVELVLEAHPSVALAAVVDVPHELYSKVGHAFVMPSASGVDTAALESWCRERLANYKVPKQFTIVPDLPLLPVGKVDKVTLKKQVVA